MLTPEQIDAAWRSVDYTLQYEDFRIAVGRAIEAEAIKDNQLAIEAAVLAEREALARRADSIGHHWSGAPATAFFEFAEEIRARPQPAPTSAQKEE